MTCSDKEDGWIGFDKYCYMVNSTEVNWAEADQFCREAFDTHLASIHTEEENEFIASEFYPFCFPTRCT